VELLQEVLNRDREGTKAFGGKFIKQTVSPVNKGGFPCIPFRAVYRNGGVQFIPYIITYYFIGCFNHWDEVILL
jgi:hypothetical protein